MKITERLDFAEIRRLKHIDPAARDDVIEVAAVAIERLVQAAQEHARTDTQDMAEAICYAKRVEQLIYRTASVPPRVDGAA